jgi:HK97 gp10 family phage protein
MKLNISVTTNLKIKEVQDKVKEAAEKALKNVIVDIAKDVVEGSPVETGNNRRSIQYEAKGLEGSIYSTSGYGGYLEVGTVKMNARPYFKPALDLHLKELPEGIKTELK